MNAYVSGYLAQRRLHIEGDQFYGTLLGYDLSGSYQQIFSSTLTAWVPLGAEGQAAAKTWLSKRRKRFSFSSYKVTPHAICIWMRPFRCTPLQYTTLIGDLAEFLSNLGIRPDSCPVCGQPLEGDVCGIVSDGARARIHAHCFARLQQERLAREERERSLPSVTALCILAALAGALAVGLVWSVAFALSYLSVVLAVFIPVAAYVLWDKAGGNNDNGKIATLWTVSLLSFLLLGVCSYIISLWIALSAYGPYDLSTAIDMLLYSLMQADASLLQLVILFLVNFAGILTSGAVLTLHILQRKRQRGLRRL